MLCILVMDYILSMIDYDEEISRGARPNVAGRGATSGRVRRSLAEYAALEYPRESLTWVLRSTGSLSSSLSAPSPESPDGNRRRSTRDPRS